ncbi:hypothetical protein KR200_000656 [Drosophila serrata]|nr:hypothetical protein KR200_000656 [Drosophila serrata]
MDFKEQALKKLYDHCVDRELPLPTMTVRKNDDIFIAECSVAKLTCCGGSENIEEACHKAVKKMFALITIQEDTQVAPVKPKTVHLRDRHNFFKNFPQALKVAAFEVILRPQKYTSTKEQAMSILAALELQSTFGEFPTIPGNEQLYKLEVECKIDCLFIAPEKDIYVDIIKYFTTMLV